jgi:ABC-type bacteriocin/lantibiotic exporter with double-glycine peptidase domain
MTQFDSLWKSLSFLRQALPSYSRLLLIGSALITALQSAALLAQPVIVGQLIDSLTSGKSNAAMLVAALSSAMILTAIVSYGTSTINNHLLQAIRIDSKDLLYRHVLALPLEFHREKNEGWFESSIAAAAFAARSIILDVAGTLVRLVAFVIICSILIIATNSTFGLIFLIGSLVFARLSLYLAQFGSRYVSNSIVKTAELSQEMSDALGNFSSIDAASTQLYEVRRLETWLKREKTAYLTAQGRLNASAFAQQIFLIALFVGIIVMSSGLSSSNVSDAVMFYIVGLMAHSQLEETGRTLNSIFEESEQLSTLLKEMHFGQVVEEHGPQLGPPAGSDITVERVNFRRDGAPIFRMPLSFGIAHGDHVLISGRSGSGKTTLLRMISGELRPSEGQVLLGGIDAHLISRSHRSSFLYTITQHSNLFDRSLYENASYGSLYCDKEKVTILLVSLGLSNLRSRRPEDWLDAKVGKSGLGLSGGEAQRVIIARAILRKPTILILDEATSALDIETEEMVLGVIHKSLPSSSIVVVSHHPHAALSGYTTINVEGLPA